MAPDALPAFHRIVDRLWRRGEWRREYIIAAEFAADTAAAYCSPSAHMAPAELEELRLLARRMLTKMWYLPPGRENLRPLDADGRDLDLLAICAPLDDAEP